MEETEYAGHLRSLLWKRPDQVDDGEPLVRGSSWWQRNDFHLPTLAWPGAWLILIERIPEGLIFVQVDPGGRAMGMMISDAPDICGPGRADAYNDGQIYVVVPQREIALGPIALPAFVGHQLGSRRVKELAELEAMRTGGGALPSQQFAEVDAVVAKP
jgi:hypothetical protein